MARRGNATTTALAASLIIKAGPGRLFGLTGYNYKGSPQYIQLHDSATLPTNAAVPKVVFRVAGGSNFSLNYDAADGREFANGIVVCNSSTVATKTIGSADCWFDGQYT